MYSFFAVSEKVRFGLLPMWFAAGMHNFPNIFLLEFEIFNLHKLTGFISQGKEVLVISLRFLRRALT